MSNTFTKEITSCLNDTLMKPLNTVIENVNKVVDNIQASLVISPKANDEAHTISITDSPVSTETVASLTTSLFNEQKERERRELNLIVHNMQELTVSEGAGRKKDDIMKVTSLMKDNIKAKPTISTGKKGSDRPPLLKIAQSRRRLQSFKTKLN